MLDALREIAWFKAATKIFITFPEGVRAQIYSALNLAATGEKGDSAKPIKGMGAGVLGNCLKIPKRRLQGCVRSKDWRKVMGRACV